MKKILPYLSDIACFVIGPYLIAYNLLNFDSGVGQIEVGTPDVIPNYYYSNDAQTRFAIGVFLVCLGFLKKYWKNKNM